MIQGWAWDRHQRHERKLIKKTVKLPSPLTEEQKSAPLRILQENTMEKTDDER